MLWIAVGLWHIIESAWKPQGDAWFHELLSKWNVKTAELVLMLCDSLWQQRNQRTFTDRELEAEYLAASTSLLLQYFHSANGWPERVSEDLLESSLLRPVPSCPRISFDVGIIEGNAGIGAVAYTANDTFIRATTNSIPGVTDPLYAEGRALEMALILADELKLEKVQIVGDCLSLIKMVRDEEETPLELDAFVVSLKILIANGWLPNPCWISRDQNSLAHSLARYAKFSLSDRATWDELPTFYLSNDVGHFQ